MLIVTPLYLAFTSCDKSPAEACDAFGKSLGEVAAKASGRVLESAKKAKAQSSGPAWDPETEQMPRGMKAVHKK